MEESNQESSEFLVARSGWASRGLEQVLNPSLEDATTLSEIRCWRGLIRWSFDIAMVDSLNRDFYVLTAVEGWSVTAIQWLKLFGRDKCQQGTSLRWSRLPLRKWFASMIAFQITVQMSRSWLKCIPERWCRTCEEGCCAVFETNKFTGHRANNGNVTAKSKNRCSPQKYVVLVRRNTDNIKAQPYGAIG